MDKPKAPFIPPEKSQTLRREIIDLLEREALTAHEISGRVGASEKMVCDALVHIQKTAKKEGHRLVVTPAVCRACDFVFKKRERLTKPGRCPLCHSESIKEPVFRIES